MWQSEEDVFKDLAFLNDFGTSVAKESYEILYSIGRGQKIKEDAKISQKFTDSKTCQIKGIDSEKVILSTGSTCYKGKGRGNLFGSSFRTDLQLQQQLRLARPLGSSNEAIEFYYGNNRLAEYCESSITSPDSELESQTQNPRKILEKHNTNLNSNENKKRVIATRNPDLQVNALISGLLSKSKVDLEMSF